MCGPRTDNHSGTRICIRPYFVDCRALHLYGWMDGKIFWVEKRTRGSTALKQCLTEDLILFSNLREILPIQGNLRYNRTFVRAKFWKRLEPSQFDKNSPINDRLRITVIT